jgi:apolipoprotein N-acyltransferase
LPETAFGYRELEDSEAGQALRDTLAMFPQPTYLLTGALLRSADDKTGQLAYHNSLLVVNQETRILESFDKFHLVPFGEYIPFQSYIPIAPIVQFSGFVEGPGPRTLAVENIPPFSPLVCYEVIFSGAVTDRDKRPQWIVNVTNDAWYGLSPGPFQHFGQTVYRAIEEGLPLVRSTNTGISAILDPYGRSVAKSNLYEDFVLESYLPSPILAPPPYTFFQDGIFLLLLIACITPIFLAITRKKIWV